MSYDVYLEIFTGKKFIEVADCGNYTYNVYRMYQNAFSNFNGIKVLAGMSAKQAIPILESAIKNMKSSPEEYKLLNPSNGWGNYEGALNYLEGILLECKEHPLTEIRIS